MASKRPSMRESQESKTELFSGAQINEEASKQMMELHNQMFGLTDNNNDTIRDISLSLIKDFHNHPFYVLDNDDMEDLVESVERNGIFQPILVRPIGSNEYECLSGHRRKHAAERLSMDKVPVIIREMSDEEAMIVVVDSNAHREKLLPSEKARALKMKVEALSLINKRNSSESFDVMKAAGEKAGMARTQVYRYLKLNGLIPELLKKVDNGSLPLNAGFDVSEFCENMQHAIDEYINNGYSVSLANVVVLKKHKDDERFTWQDILALLQRPKAEKRKLTISEKKIAKYFPETYTQKEIEDVIYSLLDGWKKENFD